MIVVDTHVLLWADLMQPQLGPRSRRLIDKHWAAGEVACCALTFWEAAVLERTARVKLPRAAEQWRAALLDSGLAEIAVDGAIAVRAAGLGGLPGDPIDRLIVATALERGAALLTADERLLGWKHTLVRHDARR